MTICSAMNKKIVITNPKYPALLKQIPDPPKTLYYKGTWDADIFKNCLAVVGSRKITRYGRKIVDSIVKEVAASGVTIVSGFMYGVDALSHQAALDAGARTIAVMPCGIEIIHPEYQDALYEKILKNKGLIISEWEGYHPPGLWMYPQRNRIVAGLSIATLVVEAAIKSGSLITAELTRQFNRKLFAVPGPLTSEVSLGTAWLIKDGAQIATSSQDILSSYGLKQNSLKLEEVSSLKLPRIEKQILKHLNSASKQIDELARLMQMSVAKLSRALTLMELKGLLAQEEGRYYVN